MKLNGLILCILFSLESVAKPVTVTFVVPDQQRPSYFWNLVTEVAKSAAEDVDVTLEVLFSDYHRFALRSAVTELAARPVKPDYVIFRPFKGNAVEVFELLESSGIPFVTLEQAFSVSESDKLGRPGEKYSQWVGMISYDDTGGGGLLTSALYKHFKKRAPDMNMQVTGLGGDFDFVAKSRQYHLDNYMGTPEDLTVNQVFPMDWSPEKVRDRFDEVYKRYPKTNAFWCAGDLMAVAVAEQLSIRGRPENLPVVIGGFDWLPEALEKISKGELTASVGGHFLMAARAVLLITEHHNLGNAFSPSTGLFEYELVDRDNIDVYLPFMHAAPWPEVDFRQFRSIRANHAPVREFTVSNLLKAYTEQKLSH